MRTLDEALNEIQFPGNKAAYDELKSLIQEGNVLSFVGAGASAPLYPTWAAVLLSLISTAKSEGRITDPAELSELEALVYSNPLDAASALEEAYTKSVFRSRLSKVYRQRDDECTDSHQLIVRLNTKGVVTLNYDNGLEVAFSKRTSKPPLTMRAQDPAELVRWLQGDLFTPSRLPILHLHGMPADPQSMVFTGEDYDKFYSNKEAGRFVEQIWRSERLLVIGFGFKDPFLTRVAEHTLLSLPSDLRHHAIIGHREPQPISRLSKSSFARKYRLSPIFYQVRDGTDGPSSDHSDLKIILQALADSITSLDSSTHLIGSTTALSPLTKVAGLTSVDTRNTSQSIIKDFEQHLHFSPGGRLLYAEPQLFSPDKDSSDPTNVRYFPVNVSDVVNSNTSYMISARGEYGLTTLCRRLHRDLSLISEDSFFFDANNLPNYKKKLQEILPNSLLEGSARAILILDNFDAERHERLLKELIGLNYFKRFILCSQSREAHGGSGVSVDTLPLKAELLVLSNLDRTNIRGLATALFDTSDIDLISTVVDKVYNDLLDLCIPLTPSNVIMYLSILHREGDFHPLNRIQIIEKYIHQLLRRPSDAYSDTFNSKNKIDVVAAFVHDLYLTGNTYFVEADWKKFCSKYKDRTLISFDDKSLMQELIHARIFIDYGSALYFKYKLFFSYFLGHYVANRPSALNDFIKSESYLSAEGLVEVISGTSVDNTSLVTDLITKLEESVSAFNQIYGLEDSDPFARLEWPTFAEEEERLWKPLSERLEAGPTDPVELDKLKRSLIAEKRTEDQTIIIRKYDEMERRMVAYHFALIETLRNSDTLEGSLKRRAVECILNSFVVHYHAGLMHSPLIAKHRIYIWNGIVFLNELKFNSDESRDAQKQVFTVMLAMAPAIARMVAQNIGSRKLSEVFRVIAHDKKLEGLKAFFNFICILRSKSRTWNSTAEMIISETDRKSYYLRQMLGSTFDQFDQEVNTGQDRDRLKRLIAMIRAKRELGKDHPGNKVINRVLGQLESPKLLFKIRREIRLDNITWPVYRSGFSIGLRQKPIATSAIGNSFAQALGTPVPRHFLSVHACEDFLPNVRSARYGIESRSRTGP